MKADYKTYRITTVAFLVVLAVNLVVPAAARAGSFYCASQTTAAVSINVEEGSTDCCFGNYVDSVSGLHDIQDTVNSCTVLQACEYGVSHSFTAIKSLLPTEKQVHSLVATAALFGSIHSSDDYFDTGHSLPDISNQAPSAPIFLLTSTFLN